MLIWQSFEVFYWLGVWMYLAGVFNEPADRTPVLAGDDRRGCGRALVLRPDRARHPVSALTRSQSRSAAVDDPAGGVFDGATDVPWRRSLRSGQLAGADERRRRRTGAGRSAAADGPRPVPDG